MCLPPVIYFFDRNEHVVEICANVSGSTDTALNLTVTKRTPGPGELLFLCMLRLRYTVTSVIIHEPH